MVAHCANQACNREFRELSKGRLFALPPTRHESPATWGVRKLSDYCYWLCPECEATHTITRDESGVVVSERNWTSARSAPALLRRPVGRAQIGLRSCTETALREPRSVLTRR
jgi:hypothetical protein